MIGLYALKPAFVARLRRVEDALVARRVSADALTYAAAGASAAAGAAVAIGAHAPIAWLAVGPLVLVRLALNALDGSVARRTHRARPFGAALNEICDRLSDILIFAPVALVAPPALVFGAIVATLLASFAGVVSQAIGGARIYAGPMGKADRMLVAGVASTIAPLAASAWTVASAVVLAGALVTFAVRVAGIARSCADRAPRLTLLREEIVEISEGTHEMEVREHAG